jgi:predicted transcriptional regulator
VSATRIDDFHPHVNGGLNPAIFQWTEDLKRSSEFVERIRRKDAWRAELSRRQAAWTPPFSIPPDQTRRADGILACIYKPAVGIKPTLPPIDAPLEFEIILNESTNYGDVEAGKVFDAAKSTELRRRTEKAYTADRYEFSERTVRMLAGEYQDERDSNGQLRYPTPWAFEGATVMSMVASTKGTVPFEEVLFQFNNNPVAGRFARTKDIAWLRRAYDGAVRKVEDGDSPKTISTRAEISRLLAMVPVMPWPGRGAINERKVLLAMLKVAYEVGNVQFNASELRISEISMVKVRQTVANALRRLQALGYITLLQSGKGTADASTYRIELSEIQKRAQNGNIPFTSSEGTLQSYALFSELFSSKVFPSCSQEVYEALHAEACTVAEVVTRSGRCIRTVRDCLKALCKYGVVRKQHGKYEVVESCDIKELARYLDVENARDQLREKHQTLRETRFDKSGKLKTKALKVALETGDVETQRLLLCPTSGVVH